MMKEAYTHKYTFLYHLCPALTFFSFSSDVFECGRVYVPVCARVCPCVCVCVYAGLHSFFAIQKIYVYKRLNHVCC